MGNIAFCCLLFCCSVHVILFFRTRKPVARYRALACDCGGVFVDTLESLISITQLHLLVRSICTFKIYATPEFPYIVIPGQKYSLGGIVINYLCDDRF